MDLTAIAEAALDAAMRRGAREADIRAVHRHGRSLLASGEGVGHATQTESLGVGIRVLVDGALGFSGTDDLSGDGIERAAARAVATARASGLVQGGAVALAPEPAHVDRWTSPCAVDPLAVPVDAQIAMLLSVNAELGRTRGVTLAEASLVCERTRQVFLSSSGSRIEQTRTSTGIGCRAYSFKDGELQQRSYPAGFGGLHQLKGYELVDELDLLGQAPRVAEEAVALHGADPCPVGPATVILDGSQLALQIHETIGHPTELDRVLGAEANFAGTSFLTPDRLGTLRLGSEIVNLVCDARPEHGPGLGTFAYDDEGVPAQAVDLVRGGLFRGYMTSRETAADMGYPRSNGTMRATGWSRLPLIRMTNVSLLPGEQSLEEVMGGADRAIYMETHKSGSIDDRRYNFQFGCEIGWELRGGRRVRMLKNPTYGGVTTAFWNGCEAIANRDHWRLWSIPICGKGQPEQVIGTGHGASPARFRDIQVGLAHG